MVQQIKCMLCGKWHDDRSKILERHIREFYRASGPYYRLVEAGSKGPRPTYIPMSVSDWERREKLQRMKA